MSSSHAARPADGVALTCLAHLEKEEAMLGAMLERSHAVRAALMSGNLADLAELLADQQHTAKAAAELYKARAQLRQTIATAIGSRDAGTLSRLVQCVSEPLRGRLSALRQRLVGMAKDVDRLNRGNMALVRQSVDLLERLLSGLTGSEQSADCYSSAGRMEERTYGSVFEAKC